MKGVRTCCMSRVTGVVLWGSLLVSAVLPTSAAAIGDTCLMTLVLPKEKIKHTCDVQEQFQKKLDSLAGEIAYQGKKMKEFEVMIKKDKSLKKTTSRPSIFPVDPQPPAAHEEDLYLSPSLPDLSDDYPDYRDFYPPDVSSRSGDSDTASDKRKGLNVLALDLLKPYIDRELARFKANITQTVRQTLHPFSTGFDEVKKFALINDTRDTNTVKPGAQTAMNTLALSHLIVQVSKVHEKLLHMNTQHIILQKKVAVMESRLLSIYQQAGQRTKDLRSRVLQLEHENRLLKLNQTCQSELQEIRLDIARQISTAKDKIRGNCKSRRRTKVRARIAQDDYYYDEDEDLAGDNVVEDDWRPLTEIPTFQELDRNVTNLQALVAHKLQRVEEALGKSQAAWNGTEERLREEVVERRQADEQADTRAQAGLDQVRQEIGGLTGQVTGVRQMATQIQEDISSHRKVIAEQLDHLKQFQADLQSETANNFTRQSELIKNTTWTIGLNIHKLQKTDEEQSIALKNAIGNSQQKLTENRLSILEWRERVTENNASLTHLSYELHSLSEEVKVSVLSLNQSMHTLGVQFRLTNETWIPYNFKHAKTHVKCFGEKYVMKTNYVTGSIVGVALCSPEMYKIFLSDSLTDTFLDVADSDGYGHDHCEFVGGKLERTSQLGNTPVFYTKQMGYKRHSWGEVPQRTYLGLLNLSPEWYRCGVSIPGR